MAQASRGVRARFFHSPKHGHVVELSMVADPFQTTSIQRVTPEHVERFPAEWDAYEAGIDKVDYGGTSLTEVPGIEASMVTAYALKGIHNAEHLADVTDGGLATFGLGARAVRDAARLVLKVKASECRDAEREVEKPSKSGKAA